MPVNILVELECNYCGKKAKGKLVPTLKPTKTGLRGEEVITAAMPSNQGGRYLIGPKDWDVNYAQEFNIHIKCNKCCALEKTKEVMEL